MGEWNATCMMTHLPIKYGERCAAFLLVGNNYRTRPGRVPVHPDDCFFPWSPLITGTYDGNGGLDEIEGEDALPGLLHRSVSNIQSIIGRPYQYTMLSDLISDAVHGDIMFQYIQHPGASVVAYPVSVTYFKEAAVRYAQEIGRPCVEYSDEVRVELLDRFRKEGLMAPIKTVDLLCDFKFSFSSDGLLPILFQTVFYDSEAKLEPLARLNAALDELRMAWGPTQAGNPDSCTKVMLDFAELTYRLAAEGYAELNDYYPSGGHTLSKLYILVGLPGAGKTTYCNTKLSKCECISPSSTLATLRKCGENASYSDAFHTACLEMNKALSSRRDVVFDATNITKKERTEILAYKPHNTVTVAIYFPAPAEPCINRNRGRRCVVPEAVVKKMAECLEFPTYDEMLDSIIVTGTDPNRKVFAS